MIAWSCAHCDAERGTLAALRAHVALEHADAEAAARADVAAWRAEQLRPVVTTPTTATPTIVDSFAP